MGQSIYCRTWLPVLLLAVACGGCKDRSTAVPSAPRARPTIACLVPAATDLIIGIGAANHLVAVSNYDIRRPEIQGLPRVGDYQSLDWERIAILRPDVMILFISPDRMPPALEQRAAQLKIRLVNMRIERLEDVFASIAQLGELADEREKAAAAAQRLRGQLEAVRQRVAGRPRVPAMIVREPLADGAVGRNTFLDDVLEIAGGENVVTDMGWPILERERMLSLRPQVVFHLLPEASPQVLQQARGVWQTLPQMPAVANGRVHILTDWWMLQPGTHLGDLAERFAQLLHGGATTRPSSRPASEEIAP